MWLQLLLSDNGEPEAIKSLEEGVILTPKIEGE
jgi:hypothetical protein